MSKWALVTGASRGIGKAVAIDLAKNLNYNILINYASNKEAALDTQAQLNDLGVQSELMQFNVANLEEVQKSINTWQESNPEAKIEVLVNNAGITDDSLFVWIDENKWDRVLDTSLKGFYNVTHTVIQKMIRQRYGRIINMVSLSGMKGNPGQVNYSAAKGGMISATKALGQELAKRKITVNAVAPGFIESDMTSDLPVDDLKKLVPMGRFGKVQEVADVVTFLASDKASYITSEVININGGLYS